MDAVKYLKIMRLICRNPCDRCYLFRDFGCIKDKEPEESVEIVEKWLDGNRTNLCEGYHMKSYREDILEKYPNVKMVNGHPAVCAKNLGYREDCKLNCHECWKTLMEV